MDLRIGHGLGPRASLSYDDSLLPIKNARIHGHLRKRIFELHEKSAINSKKRLQCHLLFRRMQERL